MKTQIIWLLVIVLVSNKPAFIT